MTRLSVAAFVKTPGLSPVKTRLASTIGREAAEEFYALAVDATRTLLRDAEAAGIVAPYWAVAEATGAAQWRDFPTVAQGEGTLGERLTRVYGALRAQGLGVALIGADAPATTVAHLAKAAQHLRDGAPYVLGPARDGGFYLFASAREIGGAVWNAVPYSQSDTAAQLEERLAPLVAPQLEARLAPLGAPQRPRHLETLGDVDTVDDLPPLADALRALPGPTAAQTRLLDWLDARV